MTPVIELFQTVNPKPPVNLDEVDVTESKIKLDNGNWVELFHWEKTMLLEILNVSRMYPNQPIHSLEEQCHQGYYYGMIYNYGTVYLVNGDTYKYRQIRYKSKIREN